MYPHERSLVEKYQDRPFVILGVNSDGSRELVKSVSEKEKLTWRSFWDGGSTQGPLVKAWKTQGFPTIYVLDGNGVVRLRAVGDPGNILEQTIEECLAELKK